MVFSFEFLNMKVKTKRSSICEVLNPPPLKCEILRNFQKNKQKKKSSLISKILEAPPLPLKWCSGCVFCISSIIFQELYFFNFLFFFLNFLNLFISYLTVEMTIFCLLSLKIKKKNLILFSIFKASTLKSTHPLQPSTHHFANMYVIYFLNLESKTEYIIQVS